MGRGRQKAKHTKVARELKYFSPDTDLSSLERELAGSAGADFDPQLDENLDKWADYLDDDDSYEDDEAVGEETDNK